MNFKNASHNLKSEISDSNSLEASSKDYKLNSCRMGSDNSKLNSQRGSENGKTSRSQSNHND